MSGHADDTLLYCIAAACGVVLAHGVDAFASRGRRVDGGHPLALALLGLAVVSLVAGGLVATSATDVLVVVASCAAVAVSALPLTGVRLGRAEDGPANPWDRAYRVQPGRVAQLLSRRPGRRAEVHPGPGDGERPGATIAGAVRPPRATPDPEPVPPGASTPTLDPGGARRGVVVPPADSGRPPASTPEVYEAEETLHDVTEVIGDLGRLLGLDRRPRREV